MEDIQSKKLEELETFFKTHNYEINIDKNDIATCTVIAMCRIQVDENGKYVDKIYKKIYDTPQEILNMLIESSKECAEKRFNYYKNQYASMKIKTKKSNGETEPLSMETLIEKVYNCKKENIEINKLIAELSYCADLARIYCKISSKDYSDCICYGHRILNGYEKFDEELYYERLNALKEPGVKI